MKNVGQSLTVESLQEIITERRSQNFYKPTDVNSVTNAINEVEVSMIFLLVTSSCGWLVNKLKGRELFPDRMNRDHLDLIFSQCDRSCGTIENVKYLIC